MRAIYTLRFGEPSVCLWIYGAELSLLPLDECSICCTDRQLSKEKGMGPLRPFCIKSCHPDQLCREGGIGEKWEGDGRNSHVTASQEDFFPRMNQKFQFCIYNASKPAENLYQTFNYSKQCSWIVSVSVAQSLHIHGSRSKQVRENGTLATAKGKISWSSCRNMSVK